MQLGTMQVISSVVPRPIGFMSTVSEKGKVNLSPYSYFGAMGHDPPMVRVPRRCTLLLPLYHTANTSCTCSFSLTARIPAVRNAAAPTTYYRTSTNQDDVHHSRTVLRAEGEREEENYRADGVQVAVGCCRSGARAGGMKDTCANALATKEFVVNIMSQWFVEAANHTCGNYDAGVNEFELAGLTPLPSEVVRFGNLCTHNSHA